MSNSSASHDFMMAGHLHILRVLLIGCNATLRILRVLLTGHAGHRRILRALLIGCAGYFCILRLLLVGRTKQYQPVALGIYAFEGCC